MDAISKMEKFDILKEIITLVRTMFEYIRYFGYNLKSSTFLGAISCFLNL